MKSERRSILKKILASVAGVAGFELTAKADPTPEKEVGEVTMLQEIPLFASHTKFNNLVFIAGKGAHVPGDVTSHTKIVLDSLEEELKKAGSSMEKVLKVNVYLDKIEDWATMNEAYKGRFGSKPPVRTTVAVKGIPGNSLVEIDCIAYI